MQRLPGLLFALGCVLLSCSCQLEPLTEVVLSIDTNYAVPDELAFVNIEVSRIEGHTKHMAAKFPRLVDLRAEPLPMTLGLSSPGGGNTFEVVVTGRAPTQRGESSGKVLVERRALFEFVSGKTLLLAMNLDRACERQVCGDDQTCGDGGKCVPVDQRGKLPPWQGKSPTLDPYRPPESDGSVAQADASMDAGEGASSPEEPPPSPTRDASTDANHAPPEEDTGRADAGLDGGTITPREDASTAQDGGTITPREDASTARDGGTVETDAGLGGGDLPPPPDLGGPPRDDDIVDLAVGSNHACVVLRNGQVWCWGGNQWGQLGVPRTELHCPLPEQTCEPTPVLSNHLADATQITAGGGFTCVRHKGGTLFCAGENDEGQLGLPMTLILPRVVHQAKETGGSAALTGMASVHAGVDFACGVTLTGNKVLCWGNNQQQRAGLDAALTRSPLARETNIAANVLSLGDAHACRLFTMNGAVSCWGSNQGGVLGIDPDTTRSSRTPMPIIAGGASILASGDSFSCAVVQGNLQCWGAADNGRIGVEPGGDPYYYPTPVTLETGGPVSAIALGQRGGCVLRDDGRVLCWGEPTSGCTGPTTEWLVSAPTLVPRLTHVRMIARTFETACAVRGRHEVYCWGYNEEGVLGPNARDIGRAVGIAEAVRIPLFD